MHSRACYSSLREDRGVPVTHSGMSVFLWVLFFPNENQLLLFWVGLGAGDLSGWEDRAFPGCTEKLTPCFSNALTGNKSYRITLERPAGFNPQNCFQPFGKHFFLSFFFPLMFVYFNIFFLLCKISRRGFARLLTGAHDSTLRS